MFPLYQVNAKPLVIAHRGGAGLWPENTLFALQEAAKLGADLSEIDIHMTRDGVLVAIHDESVDAIAVVFAVMVSLFSQTENT